MTTTTTRKLITGALRLIGVVASGEAPTEDDVEITKEALNGMIDSWSNNKLMIYTINPYVFDFDGQQSYTLGPGGNWDTKRPTFIENVYVRLNSGTPQQLDIKMQDLSDEQYADITVKNTPSTFPFAFYDNGNYPLRTLTFFPVGNGSNKCVLWLRDPLINLDDLDAEISYPPGYERCFRFNLALEVAPEFGKVVPDEVNAIALRSKEELERINSMPVYLKGDGGAITRGRAKGGASAIITGGFWTMGGR